MAKDPIGEIIKNLFTLQGVGNALAGDARELLESLLSDVIAQLARIDPTSPRAPARRRALIEKLMGEVEDLAADSYGQLFRDMRQKVAELGVQQATWAAELLETTIESAAVHISRGRLGVNFMKSILDHDPIQGELMRDWFAGAEATTVRRVRQQIQLGMAQNETIDQLLRRIRGRAVPGTGAFVGGVMQASTRDAETIARTAVNSIANTAHLETYKQYADVLKAVEFTAVLDSRTSPVCRALDGQHWPVDSPDIRRPPLHPACRSILTPVLDWEGLGLEPPPEGSRASADGQVPASVKYEDWLRLQTADVQNEILGAARAEVFRAGRVSLQQMVRTDGSQIRVAELVGAPARPKTFSEVRRVAESAWPKLDRIAGKFSVSREEIVDYAFRAGTRYRDLLRSDNINVYAPRPDGKAGHVRVTLSPDGKDVISAGMARASDLIRWLSTG
ncbi:MAG: minor capsid protein, partial [Longimicrobiales bacterium]